MKQTKLDIHGQEYSRFLTKVNSVILMGVYLWFKSSCSSEVYDFFSIIKFGIGWRNKQLFLSENNVRIWLHIILV